jgi:TRAP-type C4-dicarboxylate transport system permease small subunit
MNKDRFSYSLPELMMVIVILLIIARLIWAKEFYEFESNAFDFIGVPEWVKYILTVPFCALVIYRHYQDGAQQVKGTGRSVIGRPVIIFALGSLTVAATYLWSLSR